MPAYAIPSKRCPTISGQEGSNISALLSICVSQNKAASSLYCPSFLFGSKAGKPPS
jgi:hypothetical protein